MELLPYIETLQKNLQAAAAPAGKEIAEAATLLASALDPAARLCLLDAMAEAADEITLALEGVAVEARLHSGAVNFVVNEIEQPATAPVPPVSAGDATADDVARITLRIPESVKNSVEQAAGTENVSVNSWLVRAITTALSDGLDDNYPPRRSRRNRSFRGFARS